MSVRNMHNGEWFLQADMDGGIPTDKRSKLPRLEKVDDLSSAKVGKDAVDSNTPTANLFIKLLLLIWLSIRNVI